MGRKLTKNVWVNGEFYAAGSTPDKDVAELITNPKAWEADEASDAPDPADDVVADEDADEKPAKKTAAKKTAAK